MKKGIYYLPMFLVILANIGFTYFYKEWYTMMGWVISFFFLCEVYYLRFLK